MTLLYGRDANGNQVPLLVDGSGIVQTSGGSTSWPGTSSQLTAGDGTAVNVGSGLSLAAGTLTSPSFTTVYDLEWANKTVPTTTPAAIVDSAGRSGTWYQYATGSGQTMSTDATGLKFTTGGSISSPINRFFLQLSDFGASIYGSRYRLWYAVSGWPNTGFLRNHAVVDGDETSGGNNTKTYFTATADGVTSKLEIFNRSGSLHTIGTTAIWRATCFVIEYDGCGTFLLRTGTYSGGWPTAANLTTVFARTVTTGDLDTGFSGTGPTVQASGGYYNFTFFGLSQTNTSGYLVRSRIDVG